MFFKQLGIKAIIQATLEVQTVLNSVWAEPVSMSIACLLLWFWRQERWWWRRVQRRFIGQMPGNRH